MDDHTPMKQQVQTLAEEINRVKQEIIDERNRVNEELLRVNAELEEMKRSNATKQAAKKAIVSQFLNDFFDLD